MMSASVGMCELGCSVRALEETGFSETRTVQGCFSPETVLVEGGKNDELLSE